MATAPAPAPASAKPAPVPATTAQPEKITTIQDEQLARSAEIEAMGVDAWKAAQSSGPTGPTGTAATR